MRKTKQVYRQWVNDPILEIDGEELYFDMDDGWYWRDTEFAQYAGYYETPGQALDARFHGKLNWTEEEETYT